MNPIFVNNNNHIDVGKYSDQPDHYENMERAIEWLKRDSNIEEIMAHNSPVLINPRLKRAMLAASIAYRKKRHPGPSCSRIDIIEWRRSRQVHERCDMCWITCPSTTLFFQLEPSRMKHACTCGKQANLTGATKAFYTTRQQTLASWMWKHSSRHSTWHHVGHLMHPTKTGLVDARDTFGRLWVISFDSKHTIHLIVIICCPTTGQQKITNESNNFRMNPWIHQPHR